MLKNPHWYPTQTGLVLLMICLGVGLGQIIPGQGGERSRARAQPAASPRLSAEQATTLALNDLDSTPGGYRLRHPRHKVDFTDTGVRFTPRLGGPSWRWQLAFVGAGETALADVPLAGVKPEQADAVTVIYPRGELIEQYLGHQNTIEQQFVLPQPLALAGHDLVIEGRVASAGQFAAVETGWRWQTEAGAVQLGEVTVFDATGQTLPAELTVNATATRLVVDGPALAQATYPVTIDPEIGANDVRLSDMGSLSSYQAFETEVTYNSTANEYFVVWRGDDNVPPLVNNEFEIFGQRVNAATGALLGDKVRLSDMGPDGDVLYRATAPDVVYNSVSDEYFVVWWGDDNSGSLVDGENEIFGQRVEAATGAPIGGDIRLSDMGPDGNINYSAGSPAVAYNSAANEYLVVWAGDDNTAPLVNDEFEIFGQRVNAAGVEQGGDFRISDMGTNGQTAYRAESPDVVYNSTANEYLVVWAGDDNTPPLVDGEFEIFGQRVSATGTEIGVDFRLSDMGPNGNTSYGATGPAVAFNSAANEYLVIWMGDDDSGALVDNEFEIYGQRLNATAGELGGDFRISDMGPDGDISYDATFPAVAYNSAANQYLVVWRGDDNSGALVDNEFEVFGQRLDAAGDEVGSDFRLSDMGPDGDPLYGVIFFPPVVAYSSQANQYLVVWMGDDNESDLVDNKFEIFGQRVNAGNGAEIGGDTRLSFMGQDLFAYPAFLPDVAYNSADNEYLVVWAGRDNTPPLFSDGEFEIYAQRVDAATGAEIGPNDIRLSDMGPDGTDDYQALFPAVAYNSAANEYLVVWSGDDDVAPLADDEFEVFGQRVSAGGAAIGPNDFRLSDMGPDGDTFFGTSFAGVDVAYNPLIDQYFVVWAGNDLDGFFQTGVEIFGQRVEGASGAEIGGDIRLSDMGPENSADYVAVFPAVAFNNATNEYLVVWRGDDNSGGLVDEEFEVYGQRVAGSTGAEIGPNDFRLSDMGPDGDPAYEVEVPDVAYNSAANEYLVVWSGDDNSGGLVDEEMEIFGQRVSATGVQVGTNDFRISQMGPSGDPDYDAGMPVVAYNSTLNQYLVAWIGDDNSGGLVDDEFEVYGQQLNAGGAKLGSRIRLSDMGPDGDPSYGAPLSFFGSAAVAYGSTSDTALVVWGGSDNIKPLVSGDIEIFGQLFQAEAGLIGAETVYLPVVLK